METLHDDRRAATHDIDAFDAAQLAEIVRQALLLQSALGSKVAVEYLQAYGAGDGVIGRVLAANPVRQEDRMALAAHG